eukprot:CAMPEP_0115169178 /NCGR_PEP_ID=MMETSP0270-20121206/1137_1 /TAXON_ID=71861 /ORGANISM="Scrippsiella trochoidea, Strain CCMP3099" /LENGTH=95 /DNA_ID=CAMNT_0002581873 /DNA_START=394 /DNA_END=681 /DNA_ORIENTATION=-
MTTTSTAIKFFNATDSANLALLPDMRGATSTGQPLGKRNLSWMKSVTLSQTRASSNACSNIWLVGMPCALNLLSIALYFRESSFIPTCFSLNVAM